MPKASAFLERVLQGRSLQLEFDEQCVDKFDRRLAYVFIRLSSTTRSEKKSSLTTGWSKSLKGRSKSS